MAFIRYLAILQLGRVDIVDHSGDHTCQSKYEMPSSTLENEFSQEQKLMQSITSDIDVFSQKIKSLLESNRPKAIRYWRIVKVLFPGVKRIGNFHLKVERHG
jgi:hypothetical protein